MTDEARARLHHVFTYLIESEAKDYWHRRSPADRETHVYASVLPLLHEFGFDDLIAEDQAWRNIGSGDDADEAHELFVRDPGNAAQLWWDYVQSIGEGERVSRIIIGGDRQALLDYCEWAMGKVGDSGVTLEEMAQMLRDHVDRGRPPVDE